MNADLESAVDAYLKDAADNPDSQLNVFGSSTTVSYYTGISITLPCIYTSAVTSNTYMSPIYGTSTTAGTTTAAAGIIGSVAVGPNNPNWGIGTSEYGTPYRSWDKAALTTRLKEAQEYITYLKDSRARLMEIIG